MPPRPSMSATKYSKSYYYSERKALLLDKRDARRCANQQGSTPISHSAPEHAILCMSVSRSQNAHSWEISEPVDF